MRRGGAERQKRKCHPTQGQLLTHDASVSPRGVCGKVIAFAAVWAMQTIRPQLTREAGPRALPPNTAVCIGAFDGLHRGHRALFGRARELADRVALVTFDPHPSTVLAPQRAPALLTTAAQRERVCAALGIDDLVLLPFDREVAALSPDEFVSRVLTSGLSPAAIVVGADFRYGKGRAGSVEDLRAACRDASIQFDSVDDVLDASGERISSSVIRRLVRDGEVDRASALLDRCYAIEGEVQHGAARGRTLGFPTANVASDNAIIPRTGVYATVLSIVDPRSELFGNRYPSATNVGQNPTFEDGAATTTGVEVHAIDVDLGQALYGVLVEVGFVSRLRDEETYPDATALTEAIRADIGRARDLLDESALDQLAPPLEKPA